MQPRVESGRVAEVWAAPGPGAGTVGSGYLLRSGLLLTSGHVVDDAEGSPCMVRLLGAEDWSPANVVWRGGPGCDAALLCAEGLTVAGEVTLARLSTTDAAPCEAVGFPIAQRKAIGSKLIRDTERIVGEADPLSGAKDGFLTIKIPHNVPEPIGKAKSPWEGVSGAAVICGSAVVGALVVAPRRFGTNRLDAVPIARMVADAAFVAAVCGGEGGPLVLPAIEDLEAADGVLRDPYRPLPAVAAAAVRDGKGTSFLLRPEYGIVRFRPRTELESLDDWCTGKPGLMVRVLLGRGGTGKTRLAAELCRVRRKAGGVAGFLEREPKWGQLPRVSSPLLVVVDEAHAEVKRVGRLLSELANGTATQPVRVLLLSRQAGEWLQKTLPDCLADEPDAAFAIATAQRPELGPVDDATEDRERSFDAAATAFSDLIAVSSDPAHRPDFAAPLFELILFIHLAALTAILEDEPLPEGSSVAKELLESALTRESQYWASTAEAAGLNLSATAQARAVAVATMTEANNEDEAIAALRAISDLADRLNSELLDAARWLEGLYPLPQARSAGVGDAPSRELFRPLVPDVLGETLIASVTASAPTLVPGLLSAGSEAQSKRALSVLNQAARSRPRIKVALADVLGTQFDKLWGIAIDVARESGDPLGELLAKAVTDSVPSSVIASIRERLPRRTVALRELALVVMRRALDDALHESSGDTSLETQAMLAGLHNDLAIRLAALGKGEETLHEIEKAVAIYKRLAEEKPRTYLPNLAQSLNNKAVALGRAKRDGAALEAIDQSLDIRRGLAEMNPEKYRPQLATTLNTRAVRLGKLGRDEEAVVAIDEAIEIRRGLVRSNEEILPELAISLSNRSSRLAELDPVRALEAIDEAVRIFRDLTAERPDAYLPNLASALNKQASRLFALERAGAGLAAAKEAVAICERLAAIRPTMFLSELARSLNNTLRLQAQLGEAERGVEEVERFLQPFVAVVDLEPTVLGSSGRRLAEAYFNFSRELERVPDDTIARILRAAGEVA